jgi:hypothetical protein
MLDVEVVDVEATASVAVTGALDLVSLASTCVLTSAAAEPETRIPDSERAAATLDFNMTAPYA